MDLKSILLLAGVRFCDLFPLCQVAFTHSSRPQKSGYAWRRSKCVTSWCVECPLKVWLRTNHTNLLNTDSLVCDFSCTYVVPFKPIHHFTSPSVVAAFVVEFPMSGCVCQWKPFWIPVGESFKKAYLEEWIYAGDDSSDEQGFANFPALVQSTDNKRLHTWCCTSSTQTSGAA